MTSFESLTSAYRHLEVVLNQGREGLGYSSLEMQPNFTGLLKYMLNQHYNTEDLKSS